MAGRTTEDVIEEDSEPSPMREPAQNKPTVIGGDEASDSPYTQGKKSSGKKRLDRALDRSSSNSSAGEPDLASLLEKDREIDKWQLLRALCHPAMGPQILRYHTEADKDKDKKALSLDTQFSKAKGCEDDTALRVVISALLKFHNPNYFRRGYGGRRSSVMQSVAFFTDDLLTLFLLCVIDEIDVPAEAKTMSPIASMGKGSIPAPLIRKRGLLNKNKSGDAAIDDIQITTAYSDNSAGRALAMKVLRYYTSEPDERDAHHGWTWRHKLRAIHALILNPFSRKIVKDIQEYADFCKKQNADVECVLRHIRPNALVPPMPDGEDESEPFRLVDADFEREDNDGWCPAHWLVFSLISAHQVATKPTESEQDKANRAKRTEKKKSGNTTMPPRAEYDKPRPSRSLIDDVVNKTRKLLHCCPKSKIQRVLSLAVDLESRDVRSLLGHWSTTAATKGGHHADARGPRPSIDLGSTATLGTSSKQRRTVDYELKLEQAFDVTAWAREKNSKFEYKGCLRRNVIGCKIEFSECAKRSDLITLETTEKPIWGKTEEEFQDWKTSNAANTSPRARNRNSIGRAVQDDLTVIDIIDKDWIEVGVGADWHDRLAGNSNLCFYTRTHCVHLLCDENKEPLFKVLDNNRQERYNVTLAVLKFDPDAETKQYYSDGKSVFENPGRTDAGKPNYDLNVKVFRAGAKCDEWEGASISNQALGDDKIKNFPTNAVVEISAIVKNLFDLRIGGETRKSETKLFFRRQPPRRKRTLAHWLASRTEFAGVFAEQLGKMEESERMHLCKMLDRPFITPLSYFLNATAHLATADALPESVKAVTHCIRADKFSELLLMQLSVPKKYPHIFYTIFNKQGGSSWTFFETLLNQVACSVELRELVAATILGSACYMRDRRTVTHMLEVLTQLAKKGSETNNSNNNNNNAGVRVIPSSINKPSIPGECPLTIAARTGDKNTIRLLLEAGADPIQNGAMALWECFRNRNYDVAAQFIEKFYQIDFSEFACFSSSHPELHDSNGSKIPYYPPPCEEVMFFESNKLFDRNYHLSALKKAKCWFAQDDLRSTEALGALLDCKSTNFVQLIDKDFLETCHKFPRINRRGELLAMLCWACSTNDMAAVRWGDSGRRPTLSIGGVFIDESEKDALQFPFHFLLDKAMTFQSAKLEYWDEKVWRIGDEELNRTQRMTQLMQFALLPVEDANIVLPGKDKGFVFKDDGTAMLNTSSEGLEFNLTHKPQHDNASSLHGASKRSDYMRKDDAAAAEGGCFSPTSSAPNQFKPTSGRLSALGHVTIDPSFFTRFIPPDAKFFAFIYDSKPDGAGADDFGSGEYNSLVSYGGYIYFDARAEAIKIVAVHVKPPDNAQAKPNTGDRMEVSDGVPMNSASMSMMFNTDNNGSFVGMGDPSQSGEMGSATMTYDTSTSGAFMRPPTRQLTSTPNKRSFSHIQWESVVTLTFVGPLVMSFRDAAKFRNRWRPVTIPEFTSLGALRYMWIIPGESEQMHSRVDVPHGAFAYEFANGQHVIFPLAGKHATALSPRQLEHIDLAESLAKYLCEMRSRAARLQAETEHKKRGTGAMDEFRKFASRLPKAYPPVPDKKPFKENFPRLAEWGIQHYSPLYLAVHMHQVKLLQAMLTSGDFGTTVDTRGVEVASNEIDNAHKEQLENLQYEHYTDLWIAAPTKGPAGQAKEAATAAQRPKNSEADSLFNSPNVLDEAVRLSFQPQMDFSFRAPQKHADIENNMFALYVRAIDPKPGVIVHPEDGGVGKAPLGDGAAAAAKEESSMGQTSQEEVPKKSGATTAGASKGIVRFEYGGVDVGIENFEFARGARRGSLGIALPKSAEFYAFLLPTKECPLLPFGGFVFADIEERAVALYAFVRDITETLHSSKTRQSGACAEPPPFGAFDFVMYVSGPFPLHKDVVTKVRSRIREAEDNRAAEDERVAAENTRAGKKNRDDRGMSRGLRASAKDPARNVAWACCGFDLTGVGIAEKYAPLPASPFGGLLLYLENVENDTTSPTVPAPMELFVIQERAVLWDPTKAAPELPRVPVREVIVRLLVESSIRPQSISGDDPLLWEASTLEQYYDRFGIFHEVVGTKAKFSVKGFCMLLQYGYLSMIKELDLLEKAPFRKVKSSMTDMMLANLYNAVGLYVPTDMVRTAGWGIQCKQDGALTLLHWALINNDREFLDNVLSNYRWDLWEDASQQAEDWMLTSLRRMSPVHYGAYSGAYKALDLLFDEGQKFGKLPFCNMEDSPPLSRVSSQVSAARRILDRDGGGNSKTPVENFNNANGEISGTHAISVDPKYETELEESEMRRMLQWRSEAPLFIAAKYGHAKTCRFLMSKGADPRIKATVEISTCFDKGTQLKARIDAHDVAISRLKANALAKNKRLTALYEEILSDFEEKKRIHNKMAIRAVKHILFEVLTPLLIVIFGMLYIQLLFADTSRDEYASSIYWSGVGVQQHVIEESGFTDVNSRSAAVSWLTSLPSVLSSDGDRFPLLGAIQAGKVVAHSKPCTSAASSVFVNTTCYSAACVPPPAQFQLNRTIASTRSIFSSATRRYVDYSAFHWQVLSGNYSSSETAGFFSSADKWLTADTQLIVLYMSFYMETLNRVVSLRAVIEAMPFGALIPSYEVSVFRHSFHTSEPQDRSRYAVEALSIMLYSALFLYVVFAVYMILKGRIGRTASAFTLFKEVAQQEGWRLCMILMMTFCFAFAGHFQSKARDLEGMTNAALVDDTSFVDTYDITHAGKSQRRCLAFIIAMAAFGVISGIRYAPHLGQPADAILRTILSTNVLVFFFLFFIVWMAISVTLYTIFSPSVYGYRAFWTTIVESFITVAAPDPDLFTAMDQADEVAAPMMMVLLVICIQLTFLNILIAVIGDVYNERLHDAKRWWAESVRDIIRMYNGRRHREVANDVEYLSEAHDITSGLHTSLPIR